MISKNDIKIYRTSPLPNSPQPHIERSTGGYASTTPAFPSTTLVSAVGSSSLSLVLSSATNFIGRSKIAINDEIIEVVAVSGANLTVVSRGACGTKARPHPAGSIVVPLGAMDLFNGDLNDDLRQYRCLAVANASATETAKNVSVYLRFSGKNPACSFRYAVVRPPNDAYSGTANSGTSLSISDSSIPAGYVDNSIVGALIKSTSGGNINQIRRVISYDASTKTAVFDSSFPIAFASGDQYVLFPGPCSRQASGTTAPQGVAFTSGTTPGSASAVSSLGRVNGGDLKPNDLIYVWVERELIKNANPFDNNGMSIAVRYEK